MAARNRSPRSARGLTASRLRQRSGRAFSEQLSTGVRAIDGLLACGQGQRLGIFAGSGVGKSVLLGMMARYTKADVIVIGLVGERGREVNDFIERDLGPQGLARVSSWSPPATSRRCCDCKPPPPPRPLPNTFAMRARTCCC